MPAMSERLVSRCLQPASRSPVVEDHGGWRTHEMSCACGNVRVYLTVECYNGRIVRRRTVSGAQISS